MRFRARRMSCGRTILLLLATLIALPAAHAAEPLDPADVQRHLTRAAVFVEQKDCAGALRELEPIDGWFRTHGDQPHFRWHHAVCLADVGRPREALESFGLMLELDIPPATRDAVRAQIDRLHREQLGRLDVTCEPADAVVEVEGITRVPLPCPVSAFVVPIGARRVTVTSPGDIRWTRALVVEPGQTIRLTARVPSELVVASRVPGSHVQVDGRYIGAAGPGDPQRLRGLRPGSHTVRVTGPDGEQTWTGRVRLGPGERTRITAELTPPERPVRSAKATPPRPGADPGDDADDDTLLWVGVGVGAAVAVGVGVALFLSRDDEPPSPVDFHFEGER